MSRCGASNRYRTTAYSCTRTTPHTSPSPHITHTHTHTHGHSPRRILFPSACPKRTAFLTLLFGGALVPPVFSLILPSAFSFAFISFFAASAAASLAPFAACFSPPPPEEPEAFLPARASARARSLSRWAPRVMVGGCFGVARVRNVDREAITKWVIRIISRAPSRIPTPLARHVPHLVLRVGESRIGESAHVLN